jgi:GntR family transcriptional repressor for pyruvate dehydrogenase complex
MTNLFKPIRPKKISEEIIEQIQKRIADGHLKPGERIPSERDLAALLGVSRPSVREAIMSLHAMGLLESRQGGGTYVCSLADGSMSNAMAQMLADDPKLLNDLLEVRIGLECWSAFLAAKRATDDDLDQIKSYMDKMRADVHDGWDPKTDCSFHDAIASASHNTMQIHILSTVHSLFLATIELALHRFYDSRKEYSTILLGHHQAIYDKIADRDPEGAKEAMFEHLHWVQEKLPQILDPAA